MDVFEYLPQLIVAYDDNDEFANLIHVNKADKNNDYYCPCCRGIVKPRALKSTKEQSHYYHITGKCTKESQLHFFCKNWLFEKGSKFYINNELFEVESIDIEKSWDTLFGDYKPDVTVHTTSGKIIYFEMFFSNRKTGDDYFCKWNALGNDVVEVNIKEYLYKTDVNVIPSFTYLYHDGFCYSKTYEKRDLYATTIAKIKKELTRQKVLNYKARIEQLDWFWKQIQDNQSKESILKSVLCMEYDDMISCYEIIKRKHCVAFLKDDLLKAINQKVVKDIGKELNLPEDENIYFDLKHHHGRTYEFGIRLNITLLHIIFDDYYKSCKYNGYTFEKSTGYPKVVFKKNIFSYDEIRIPRKKISELKNIFRDTIRYKETLLEYEKDLCDLENNNGYQIRVKNNFYTVLQKTDKDCYDVILDNYKLNTTNINVLKTKIAEQLTENEEKKFVDFVKDSRQYSELIEQFNNYCGINSRISFDYYYSYYGKENGIYVNLWLYGYQIHSEKIRPSEDELLDVIYKFKKYIDDFILQYAIIFDLISHINNCKNKLWNAEFNIDYNGMCQLLLYINICSHINNGKQIHKNICLSNIDLSDRKKVIHLIEKSMKNLIKESEHLGYRIWFEGRN